MPLTILAMPLGIVSLDSVLKHANYLVLFVGSLDDRRLLVELVRGHPLAIHLGREQFEDLAVGKVHQLAAGDVDAELPQLAAGLSRQGLRQALVPDLCMTPLYSRGTRRWK